MSYNIDTWKLKKVDLILPKGFNMETFSERAFGQIEVNSNLEDWEYNWDDEGLGIKGKITNKGLEVTDIQCRGEGSGNDYYDLLVPLVQKFNGYVEAGTVWEGGDTIAKITIDKAGEHSEEVEI